MGSVHKITYYMTCIIRLLFDYTFIFLGFCFGQSSNKKSVKTKIAFQAFSIHLAMFYDTLVHEFHKDDTKEVFFIILRHPQFPINTQEIRKYATSILKIPESNVFMYWQTIWKEYDIVFYTDIFAKFPIRSKSNWLLKHGVGVLPRHLNKNWLRHTIYDFDFVLNFGPQDLYLVNRYAKNNQQNKKSKILCVGCPHFDNLNFSHHDKIKYFEKHKLALHKKTILIAPHWNTDTWQKIKDIVNEIMVFNVNIVIKMHYMLFIVNKNSKMQLEEIKNFSIDNKIVFDYYVDDIPAFLYSDILISDVSSRIFVYIMLDKPAVSFNFMCKKKEPLLKERQKLINYGGYIIHSKKQLYSTIEKVLKEPSEMSEKRKYVSDLCFANPKTATVNVIKLINDYLQNK